MAVQSFFESPNAFLWVCNEYPGTDALPSLDRQQFNEALAALKISDREAWTCLVRSEQDACDYLVCSRRSYYRYRARGLDTMVNLLLPVVECTE